MSQWYAAIEKANNGYIVRCNGEYEDDDGESVDEVLVIQQQEMIMPVTESNVKQASHLAELKAFEELVHTLKEHFAVINNKYDKHYLQVRIMERTFTEGIPDKPLEDD